MSSLPEYTAHVVTGSSAGRANPVFDLLGVSSHRRSVAFFSSAGLIGRARKVTCQANQIIQPLLVLNKAPWLIQGHS